MFRHSLERSDAVLRPHGVALCEMINRADDETFANTINSFVAIVAIQVKSSSICLAAQDPADPD